ncbi:hypothetical protein ABPG72_014926 [Tetrahymena utriculariae]
MNRFNSLFKKNIYYGSQLLPGKKHTKIIVGDYFLLKRKYTEQQVKTYAEISGDNNPIHTDEEAGKKSIFKQRVAHGMLTGGIFGQMLGSTLHDAIYLNQTLKFTAPVYLNEEVEGRMEVIDVNYKKKFIKLKTSLHKIHENDKIAVEGEAMVLYKYLEE